MANVAMRERGTGQAGKPMACFVSDDPPPDVCLQSPLNRLPLKLIDYPRKENFMDNIAIQTASQLDAAARDWLEQLFGRALREDEEITILVPTAHDAPASADQVAALRRADVILDQAAENMRGVADDEFDEALDDALRQIRNRTN